MIDRLQQATRSRWAADLGAACRSDLHQRFQNLTNGQQSAKSRQTYPLHHPSSVIPLDSHSIGSLRWHIQHPRPVMVALPHPHQVKFRFQSFYRILCYRVRWGHPSASDRCSPFGWQRRSNGIQMYTIMIYYSTTMVHCLSNIFSYMIETTNYVFFFRRAIFAIFSAIVGVLSRDLLDQ